VELRAGAVALVSWWQLTGFRRVGSIRFGLTLFFLFPLVEAGLADFPHPAHTAPATAHFMICES